MDISGYAELKSKIEKDLAGEGRILVRYSGTENVARILVEGPDKMKIAKHAEAMGTLLEKNLK